MPSKKSDEFDEEIGKDARKNKTPRRGEKGSESQPRRKKNETPKKRLYRQAKKDELFDYQPTGTNSLPPAREFVTVFVPRVLESIHGLREVRSFARHMNYSVYSAIEARAASVRLRSQLTNEPEPRPVFSVGNVIISEPRDGVCEAAAIVHGPTRVRAVALRLEGLDSMWKATSFRML
jgi:hypothetical protein